MSPGVPHLPKHSIVPTCRSHCSSRNFDRGLALNRNVLGKGEAFLFRVIFQMQRTTLETPPIDRELNWYVLYCKPHKELGVFTALAEQLSLPAYLPVINQGWGSKV